MNHAELEDHTHSLDDEADVLQRELIGLRRAMSQGRSAGFTRPGAWDDSRGPISLPDRSRKGAISPLPPPTFRKRTRE